VYSDKATLAALAHLTVVTPPAPAAQISAWASGGHAGGRRVAACLGPWRFLAFVSALRISIVTLHNAVIR
jgi:hypothetical protein